MKKIITLSGVTLAIIFIATLGLFASKAPITIAATCDGGSTTNVRGWMWSSTVGWGSLSCKDIINIFPGVNEYGITQDTDGFWHGQAWFGGGASSNTPTHLGVGWLTFGNVNCQAYGMVGNDSTNQAVHYPCNVRKQQDGKLRGWAKFLAGTPANLAESTCQTSVASDATQAGCWDGLVSFSSENDTNFTTTMVQPGAVGYGAYEGAPNGNQQKLYGFAWGSSVVGWLGFCNQEIQMLKTGGDTTGATDGKVLEPTKLGGQVLPAYQGAFTASPLDFSGRCSSYVDIKPVTQPDQNDVEFWDYGPYCPAVYNTAELDWNLNGPSGASCTLYFGAGNGTPVMQNITGDGVYMPTLPGGAGLYHMECTNPGGSFSASYTVTALSSTDTNCTNPTTSTATATATAGDPPGPDYTLESNDNGLCYKTGITKISWLGHADIGDNTCDVIDNSGHILAHGLPKHGSGGTNVPYVYSVPGVGHYTVQCRKVNQQGSLVMSTNSVHTFEDCGTHGFSFNTNDVSLCPGQNALLTWNVDDAATCTPVGFNASTLPPGLNSTSTGSVSVGAGTYSLQCEYFNPDITLPTAGPKVINITQLNAHQCVIIDPSTGTGTGLPGTRPGTREF
jgi:hypothetical protein